LKLKEIFHLIKEIKNFITRPRDFWIIHTIGCVALTYREYILFSCDLSGRLGKAGDWQRILDADVQFFLPIIQKDLPLRRE